MGAAPRTSLLIRLSHEDAARIRKEASSAQRDGKAKQAVEVSGGLLHEQLHCQSLQYSNVVLVR